MPTTVKERLVIGEITDNHFKSLLKEIHALRLGKDVTVEDKKKILKRLNKRTINRKRKLSSYHLKLECFYAQFWRNRTTQNKSQ